MCLLKSLKSASGCDTLLNPTSAYSFKYKHGRINMQNIRRNYRYICADLRTSGKLKLNNSSMLDF
jgi:hypothetical protein